MEISALGGLDLKLSLPSFQKGMKRVVFMLPASRSGRSVKKIVTELTPVRVSAFLALSNVMPFALCTKKKSAFLGASGVVCARSEVIDPIDVAISAAVAITLRRLVPEGPPLMCFSANKN